MTTTKKQGAFPPLPKNNSEKRNADIFKKAAEQYRAYKKIHNVENFIRNINKADNTRGLPPSSDYSRLSAFNVNAGE